MFQSICRATIGAAAIIAALVMVQSGSAMAKTSICTSQLVRNPVLLLFNKPERRLIVIKSGRKIRQIEVANKLSDEMLPDGVYSILRERNEPLRSRFQFMGWSRKPSVAWRGKALFAEGSMKNLKTSESIQLPQPFAKKLIRVTAAGAVLVVASDPSALKLFDDIGFFDERELEPVEVPDCSTKPDSWKSSVVASPDDPVAVVISERDRKVYIYEGGDLVSSHGVSVRFPHRDTGRHLFIAIKPEKEKPQRRWLALSLAGGGFVEAPPVKQANDVLDRFEFEPSAQGVIDEYINRGVVLLVVERSAKAESKTERLMTLLRSGP